jgi:hypothetical protein
MTDAERAALVAALMDDGMNEFQALREVERYAAEIATMTAETRFKPVFCLSGKAQEVIESVAAHKAQFGK